MFLFVTAHVSLDQPIYTEGSDKVPIVKDIQLNDIQPNDYVVKDVYLRAWSTGERKVIVKVSVKDIRSLSKSVSRTWLKEGHCQGLCQGH